MSEIVEIQLADLLLDPRNARLKDEQSSQQETLLSLAQQQGRRLIALARHIVEKQSLDPTSLPAVVATSDQKKRYRVLEGNRRVVALKALETPSLVAPAFNNAERTELNRLAERFAQAPVTTVQAVLFASEAEAAPWIELRHTGANEGAGLVEWGSEEKDRHFARRGTQSPVLQILEFVDRAGLLSPEARASKQKVHTSVRRLINTPAVRERLGIEIVDGQVLTHYPKDQTAKALTRVVEDLKTERKKVKDIYHVRDRLKYARDFPKDHAPKRASRLPTPTSLEGAPQAPVPTRRSARRKRRESRERTVLIPSTCQLEIGPPRINHIYNELTQLSTVEYPNATSVLLRVFLELSVDHYIETKSLLTDDQRRATPLAKRMKTVAADLRKSTRITSELEGAVKQIADSVGILAASSTTFNQYVHNRYVYPKPKELKLAFDQLQPFFEALWP